MDIEARRRGVEDLREAVRAMRSKQAAVEHDLVTLDRSIERFIRAARGLGSNLLPQHVATPRPGAVLLFHRVAALDRDKFGLCVPPEMFRLQMEHVARTCEPMTLRALADAASIDALPRRAVAITIDGGYLDAFAASDVLCRLHLPATFFVSCGRGQETFHDTLARIFLDARSLPRTLDISVSGSPINVSCAAWAARRSAFDVVSRAGWTMSGRRRRALVDALRQWSGVDLTPRRSHRMLTSVELRALASRPGHEIGALTENHLFLPAQPRTVKMREIAHNRASLQSIIKREVRSFAYPYGAVDRETLEICRDMGFRNAVGVGVLPVRGWDDPLFLPRREITERTIDAFETALATLLD